MHIPFFGREINISLTKPKNLGDINSHTQDIAEKSYDELSKQEMEDRIKLAEKFLPDSEKGFTLTAGRSSAVNSPNMLSLLISEMETVTPEFPIEMIKLCTHGLKLL